MVCLKLTWLFSIASFHFLIGVIDRIQLDAESDLASFVVSQVSAKVLETDSAKDAENAAKDESKSLQDGAEAEDEEASVAKTEAEKEDVNLKEGVLDSEATANQTAEGADEAQAEKDQVMEAEDVVSVAEAEAVIGADETAAVVEASEIGAAEIIPGVDMVADVLGAAAESGLVANEAIEEGVIAEKEGEEAALEIDKDKNLADATAKHEAAMEDETQAGQQQTEAQILQTEEDTLEGDAKEKKAEGSLLAEKSTTESTQSLSEISQAQAAEGNAAAEKSNFFLHFGQALIGCCIGLVFLPLLVILGGIHLLMFVKRLLFPPAHYAEGLQQLDFCKGVLISLVLLPPSFDLSGDAYKNLMYLCRILPLLFFVQWCMFVFIEAVEVWLIRWKRPRDLFCSSLLPCFSMRLKESFGFLRYTCAVVLLMVLFDTVRATITNLSEERDPYLYLCTGIIALIMIGVFWRNNVPTSYCQLCRCKFDSSLPVVSVTEYDSINETSKDVKVFLSNTFGTIFGLCFRTVIIKPTTLLLRSASSISVFDSVVFSWKIKVMMTLAAIFFQILSFLNSATKEGGALAELHIREVATKSLGFVIQNAWQTTVTDFKILCNKIEASQLVPWLAFFFSGLFFLSAFRRNHGSRMQRQTLVLMNK